MVKFGLVDVPDGNDRFANYDPVVLNGINFCQWNDKRFVNSDEPVIGKYLFK